MEREIVLSVVIPVYNEKDTIERVVGKVRQCGVKTEIIIVDDYSTDGTRRILRGGYSAVRWIRFCTIRKTAGRESPCGMDLRPRQGIL